MTTQLFFRIIMPYGFERNESGEWCAFNREYAPIGMKEGRSPNLSGDLLNYHKIEGLSDLLIQSLVDDDSSIKRDSNGKIHTFFLYNDSTNPTNVRSTEERIQLYTDYFSKLQSISERNCEALSRPLHK